MRAEGPARPGSPLPARALALLGAILAPLLGADRGRVEEWLVREEPTTLHPLAERTSTDALVTRLAQGWVFEPVPGGWESRLFAPPTTLGRVVSLSALPEARWSDGEPVVGADLCATLARLGDRSRPTRWTAGTSSRIEGCTHDPDHPEAAAVTLTEPLPDPRAALEVPLLPAHRPDWTGYAGGPEPSAAGFVGAGVWRPRWRDDALQLWPRGGAATPIRLVVEEDPVDAFLRGRGDRVEAGPADLPALRRLPEVQVERVRPAAVWALFLDTSRPPWDDPSLRQALDRALDRDALAAAVLGRDPELQQQPWGPASGPFPPGSALASRGTAVPPPDSTALLERAPVPLEVVVPPGRGGFLVALAEALPGVAVSGRELTREQWALSLLDGGHGGAAHAALVRLEEAPCDHLHTRTGRAGFANPFGFSDPGVDRACEALGQDPEAGPVLHGRLADLRPAIFLWWEEGRVARRVR